MENALQKIVICPQCLGNRKIRQHHYLGPMHNVEEYDCPNCGGQGVVIRELTIKIAYQKFNPENHYHEIR